MRQLVVIALLLVVPACGHPPTTPSKPKPGDGSNTVAKKPTPKIKPGDPVLPDIGCPTTSCAYHPGVGSYFTCLAGGAGVCFHFGGTCSPPDGCMFDPADKTYKQCKTPVEGACAAWAAACAPASKCMVEPATGLYRHCESPASGTCKSYGAVCAP